MNRRGYRHTRSAPLWVRTAAIILLLFFLFLAFMTIFRRGSFTEPDVSTRTSDDIVAELNASVSTSAVPRRETPRGIPESTTLLAVSGTSGSAIAKRVLENNFFTHTILAQGLLPIDESRFRYQAWLIRPYPFDFFETSALVHNADDSWGMIWVGDAGETYDEFVEVLITREPIDDFDENPSADQVLQGSF